MKKVGKGCLRAKWYIVLGGIISLFSILVIVFALMVTPAKSKEIGVEKEVTVIKGEKEQAQKEAEEQAQKEAEKYNTGITFEDLARKPKEHIGSYVKFSGKIIQVINGDGIVQYRMAIDGDINQIVLIEISKSLLTSGNILEHDYITIEGMFWDEIEYTTVMGDSRTIPAILVDHVYQ